MPKIAETDYVPLKAFFVAWHDRHPISFPISADHHPVAVLNSLERESMSRARSGLGLAIADTIEMSWDLSPAEVAAIDRDFSAAGILTLSELRRRYSRQFRGVLKRGKIRDESEFYLISGILASFTSDEEDGIKLDAMIGEFERSRRK